MRKTSFLILIFLVPFWSMAYQGSPQNLIDSLMQWGQRQLALKQLSTLAPDAPLTLEENRVKRAERLYQLEEFDSASQLLNEHPFVFEQSRLKKAQLQGDLALAGFTWPCMPQWIAPIVKTPGSGLCPKKVKAKMMANCKPMSCIASGLMPIW